MGEFFQAVSELALFRNALLAGVLASVACGVVGTYVVVRRITYLAGGIAHCVLGGMGVEVYLRATMGWPRAIPLTGAIVAAVLAAAIIGVVSLRARQREDTVISALWAVGMAVGVLFIGKTPQYQQDLMSYLFGHILMVPTHDLWLVAGLDAVVVTTCMLLYRQFEAICFDEEYARTRGLPVDALYMLLLILVALTVVLLVTVVGIVLVIALLTLPVACAGQFAGRLWQTMVAAAALSMVFVVAGMAISYQPNLESGATIVVLAGGTYLLTVLLAPRLRRSKTGTDTFLKAN